MFLIGFIAWISGIWVYNDAKKWRAKGILLRPALVASGYLLWLCVTSIVVAFGPMLISFYARDLYSIIFTYNPAAGMLTLLVFVPLALYLYRRRGYKKMITADSIPLPPTKDWRWLYFFIQFAPFVFGVALALFILLVFSRGNLFF